MVIFLNQKTHLHTAYHQTLKSPWESPEVLNKNFLITFHRAQILHILFNNWTIASSIIWSQKKRFFQKPTYHSLRQPLEAMTNHANKHKVTQISMPKAGCGLDWLE